MHIDRFVHLHLHTEYSLLDGAIRLKELPGRLKELGMQACAITDHGALYGVVDFYTAMMKAGLKPLIGCEVYLAPRSHLEKQAGQDNDPDHLVLLAENNTGYRNLMKLVSIGFIDGFYYKPRIDLELLRQYSDGLIALSACLSGPLARLIKNGRRDEARQKALELNDIFGSGQFYLEIQNNGLPEQATVNSALIEISRETNIPLVATNDCHYLNETDAYAHEVLLCMQTGKRMQDEDRMRMDSSAFYLKSPEEMTEAFAGVPAAIHNTIEIARRCNVTLALDQIHLPEFALPDGQTNELYLKNLCRAGLEKRLENIDGEREVYFKRLDHELQVIAKMGYTDYYLIVWDFIRFARSENIFVGPGRGSGAGSVAAWALWITNIDPIRYGLIFERFLNADRVSMPDFDIDFCYERRQEVIDYVTAKYGQDRVAQVITFGTLAARASIRDVARALDLPYSEADTLAKMIPAQLGITIDKALKINPELEQAYRAGGTARDVLDLARRFEGMPRHASTHAAGVVIANRPLTDLAPLARNDEAVVVQFAKNNLERIGLLKFDFLGLRTLTVLRDTADMVGQNHGVTLDYDRILLDDPAVYKMIADGQTEGIFQLESPGMTSFLKDLRPETFEDIIAGISLYRPGPMEQIPQYVRAKHDPAMIRYDHPLLEPILNVTYGCIVYQEQVMQIVRDLAGFSLGQSDNVRRAMSKKLPEELAQYKNLFLHGGRDEKDQVVPGALARGVDAATANKIFDEVMAFAGYAFNKSHAAAYALLAYQTGWLKCYYPVELMAAVLNSYLGNLTQANSFVRVCRALKIRVLPPDVNLSQTRFSTENGAIRFALAGIKNVGQTAVDFLIEEREKNGPFKSYGDFLRRLEEARLNRKMIESLIRASALDTFGVSRSQMIAVIEPFLNSLAGARKSQMAGQLSLFDFSSETKDSSPEPEYPNVPDFSRQEMLKMEKEMLGLYISGHPLDEYAEVISRLTTNNSTDFARIEDESAVGRDVRADQQVVMAGIVTQQSKKLTRKNEWMSFLTLEDLEGIFEVIVFPNLYQKIEELIAPGNVLVFKGRVSLREDEAAKLIAETGEILKPDLDHYSNRTQQNTRAKKTAAENRRGVCLCLRVDFPADSVQWRQLKAMLTYFQGDTPVRVFFAPDQQVLNLADPAGIELNDRILKRLAERIGPDNLALIAKSGDVTQDLPH